MYQNLTDFEKALRDFGVELKLFVRWNLLVNWMKN